MEHRLGPAQVPRLQLAWAAQLGELVFASSPVVAGGVAYIGSMDGTLWAYPAKGCGQDLCTQPLWRSTSLSQIIDSPTVKDGVVYVGSQASPDSNDGRLNAFAAAGCGQDVCPPLWQGRAGKDSILQSSPTVADGVVFVGAFDGRLYAFAAAGCGAARCEPLWTGQLPGPAYGSSPAYADGLVYIGAAHGLAAFDAAGCGSASCAPRWQAVDKLDFYGGSPAVAEGRVYIGWESELAVFDAAGCGGQARCQPLWRLFGPGFQAAIESSPTVANGVVYAGRNTGELLAWKSDGCGQYQCGTIWSATVREPIVNSSPTVVNGRVYIGSADNTAPENMQGRLYVFELP